MLLGISGKLHYCLQLLVIVDNFFGFLCDLVYARFPLPCVICSEPRGFGFVQYVDPADAAEAKYHMDGYVLLGRELTVVFAEENRKKPSEMRHRERGRYSSVYRNIVSHLFGIGSSLVA